MSDTTGLLDRVSIAKPCKADWAQMTGDDRVRRCDLCSLDVYDLSAMPRPEAEAFVAGRAAAGGRTCVRIYRRADGRLLTSDCPVGLAAVRRRLAWAAAAFVAAGVAAAGIFFPRDVRSAARAVPPRAVPVPAATPPGEEHPVEIEMGDMVKMGEMEYTPPTEGPPPPFAK